MKDPVHYANLKDFGKREIETFILFGKYFFPESTINKLEIDKSISLIDIGCGDKYLKYGCDEYNIDYVGIDFSDCNIEKEYLDYPDNSFDIVTSLALLEHLYDPSILISEAYRILKPNGIFVLSTPNWRYTMRIFFDDPTHIHPYTVKSLKYLLEISNFKYSRVVPNLRCQEKSNYIGDSAFFRAAFLRPFTNSPKNKLIPNFLKGKALGLFGICQK